MVNPKADGVSQLPVIGQANARAGPLQPFLVAGATGGHQGGGAGQLPVIGRGVPGQGRCSRSWSPAQPVAIEQVVLVSSR